MLSSNSHSMKSVQLRSNTAIGCDGHCHLLIICCFLSAFAISLFSFPCSVCIAFYLSLSLSLSLHLPLFLSPSLTLSIYICISVSISLYISPSLFLTHSLTLSFSLSSFLLFTRCFFLSSPNILPVVVPLLIWIGFTI